MTNIRDLLKYRDLVIYLVRRELKVRYRRTVLGFFWTMLQPLMMMVVLHLVFSSVFRFDLPQGNYAVYALTGILFWNFFSQSITTSMNSLRTNAGLITKLPVPNAVFPIATTISGVVNLLLALVPLLLILLVTGHPVTFSLFFLPISMIVATTFTLGAGLMLSPLAVFFHDVVEFVSVILMLLMYMTPVFYPMNIIPDQYLFVVRFNPVRSILEVFRDPIYLGKLPPWTHLAVASGIALLVLVVGTFVFWKTSDRIALYA